MFVEIVVVVENVVAAVPGSVAPVVVVFAAQLQQQMHMKLEILSFYSLQYSLPPSS